MSKTIGILMPKTRLLNFLCVCFLVGCHSGYHEGPRSDHFNGEHFFNPTTNEQRNFWDALKWWATEKKPVWPEHVNNQPHAMVAGVNSPNEVKTTFIGHATLLIQSKDYTILTDPNFSLKAGPFSWLGAQRIREPGLALSELPPINAVIISHNHYDHMDIPSLLNLAKQFHPVFIVPLGNKVILESYGIKNVIELDWWQSFSTPNGSVTLLPTQHWSARWLNDRNKTLWGSYGIKIAGKSLYFGGDAGYSTHYKDIYTRWGAPDLAFLPIGAYEPRWFMRLHHMNPKEAVLAMQDLHAKQSMGIHFGTFRLGYEKYDQPKLDLAAALKAASITAEQFFLLPEGQSWMLK